MNPWPGWRGLVGAWEPLPSGGGMASIKSSLKHSIWKCQGRYQHTTQADIFSSRTNSLCPLHWLSREYVGAKSLNSFPTLKLYHYLLIYCWNTTWVFPLENGEKRKRERRRKRREREKKHTEKGKWQYLLMGCHSGVDARRCHVSPLGDTQGSLAWEVFIFFFFSSDRKADFLCASLTGPAAPLVQVLHSHKFLSTGEDEMHSSLPGCFIRAQQ